MHIPLDKAGFRGKVESVEQTISWPIEEKK